MEYKNIDEFLDNTEWKRISPNDHMSLIMCKIKLVRDIEGVGKLTFETSGNTKEECDKKVLMWANRESEE